RTVSIGKKTAAFYPPDATCLPPPERTPPPAGHLLRPSRGSARPPGARPAASRGRLQGCGASREAAGARAAGGLKYPPQAGCRGSNCWCSDRQAFHRKLLLPPA
ncbi:unnamed protein product, partial [Urochloa humidicola]